MKRTAMLAAGMIASAALVLGSTTQAQALWVLPSSAQLKDASGATNGCTAQIAKLSTGPIIGSPSGLRVEMSLTCPEAADVHRVSVGLALYELMPDGTLRAQIPAMNISKANTGAPFTQSGTPGVHLPCTLPDIEGTHTWVARATLRTKHSKTDTNPFIAKVHSVETLTC